MNDRVSTDRSDTDNDGLALTAEDKAKLERLRKKRLDAEYRNARQTERVRHSENRRAILHALSKMSHRTLLILAVILVVIVVLIPGVLVPMLEPAPKTRNVTESSLEKAVDINELSTLDYTYSGIAEKINSFAIGDIHTPVGDLTSPEWVDFRVKYSANIRVEFDMSDIDFEIDNESRVITVLLPEIVLGTPHIDEKSFGFLPEGKSADLADVIRLCRNDAKAEISQDTQIEERAYENLESTVTALTLPLIGDEYSLEFRHGSDDPSSSDNN